MWTFPSVPKIKCRSRGTSKTANNDAYFAKSQLELLFNFLLMPEMHGVWKDVRMSCRYLMPTFFVFFSATRFEV